MPELDTLLVSVRSRDDAGRRDLAGEQVVEGSAGLE